MNNALSFIGMMKKAGKLVWGDDACYDAVRQGKARYILLAADAGENARRRGRSYAGELQNDLVSLPFTKGELGAVLGRRDVALLAVSDEKMARALLKKLSPKEDPNGDPKGDLNGMKGSVDTL